MKIHIAAVLLSIVAIAAAPGCNYNDSDTVLVSLSEQALCQNDDGVSAVMSGLAVAAAREMARWVPNRDFQWNFSTDRLEISSDGYARCPNSACSNVQALLAMQDAPSGAVRFPGDITLNPSTLQSTLKRDWSEQLACSIAGTCLEEAHDLEFTNWEPSLCGMDYFFDVYEEGTTTRITDTATLAALADNLVFLGYPESEMLNFYLRNGQVGIDPTGGLNEGGDVDPGSCTAACSKYSTTDLTGQCCECDGVVAQFVTSTFSADIFLCE